MSKLRVGINGFGRIGRILFRAGYEKLDIVGINDPCGIATSAHLLKYDSTHGRFPGSIEAKENSLLVNNKNIPFSQTKNPAEIPWKDWEVDVVLECTGAFNSKAEELQKHIAGGAKKVLVSAPAEAADFTAVYGVNHAKYDPDKHSIISNASCTTNCLAPVAKILHENFGIESGLMTTVHAYTSDQRLLDNAHKDLRRARAAALSMIPTSTGAAIAVTKVLPELKGRLDGLAVRVPTPNVSLVDFTVQSSKAVTKEAINEVLTNASNGDYKGILEVATEPLVSCDFNGSPESSIIDAANTMVINDTHFKVFAWYDNETGFSNRMVDLAIYLQERGL